LNAQKGEGERFRPRFTSHPRYCRWFWKTLHRHVRTWIAPSGLAGWTAEGAHLNRSLHL